MVPKTEFYEGELVPVQVRVIVPEEVQASYSETPQAESGGFTVDPLLSKPAQTEEMIDGRPCAVLAWTTALRALKPGTYTVDLTMPLTVITPPQMPQMGDDDSINNFFRNAFAAVGGTRKDVQLSSKTDPLKILPLPQAGRPASFQGAVGRFDVEAGAAPTQVTAGDPITLTLKVSGRGNFDRVNSDMLAGSANWKTYSPKSHFDASDSLGYQGVKTFEQPVIANSASVTQVPSLEFSYFDPETRQYVTRTTSPVPLNVSGALAPTAPVNAPASAPLAASAPPPAPAPSGPDLRMNRVEPGAFVATLRPVYLSPLFLAGQALPLLALLGGLAFLRRRQRMAHPERVRLTAVQQAIRREVEGMEAAMRDHQAAPFFVHGRNALQQHFGPQWNVRPEAITVHDLDARLGAGAENLRTVFELADQASYSDPAPWRRRPPGLEPGRARCIEGDQTMKALFKTSCLLLLVLAGLLAPLTARAANATSLDDANRAFAAGKFPEAAAAYQAVLAQSGYSAPVLFDLGNAFFRQGDLAQAILAYKRALWLTPGDEDILANLQAAQKQAGFAVENPPGYAAFTHLLSASGWAWLACLAWTALCMLLLLRVALPRRRAFFSGGAFTCVLVLAAALGSIILSSGQLRDAVVVDKNAAALISPFPAAQSVFTPAPGQTLKIEKAYNDFLLVSDGAGHAGWIARTQIAPVVPAS